MNRQERTGYLRTVFLSIDQLGNALTGGNEDNTISARVGYFANHKPTKLLWYWKLLETIIDFTFWPLDGKKHCDQAYHEDAMESFEPGQSVAAHVLLWLFVILICWWLGLAFYLLLAIGIVRPKPKTAEELIKNKLDTIKLTLSKTERHIQSGHFKVNRAIKKTSNELSVRAGEFNDFIQRQ